MMFRDVGELARRMIWYELIEINCKNGKTKRKTGTFILIDTVPETFTYNLMNFR